MPADSIHRLPALDVEFLLLNAEFMGASSFKDIHRIIGGVLLAVHRCLAVHNTGNNNVRAGVLR